MKRVYVLVAIILLAFTGYSCELNLNTIQPGEKSHSARFLIYMHTLSHTPPDVRFTISRLSLVRMDDSLVDVLDSPVTINSLSLKDGQILLSAASPGNGRFRGLKMVVSSAYVMGREGYVSLALPQPEGGVFLEKHIEIKRGESMLLSLVWDAERSIRGGYSFQPLLKVKFQEPSVSGLLMFVSVVSSNFIAVIDRGLERVVGVISVGNVPMGMAVNSVQTRLFVVNSEARSVSVVDVKDFHIIETIPLTVGIKPADLVFVPDAASLIEGRLFIINRLSNDVTVVDTATGRILITIPVGIHPSDISVDTERKEVYVTNESSNTLSIISTVDNSLIGSVTVGNRPTGIILRKDIDRVLVLNEGSRNISVVSPSQRKTVETIPLPLSPHRGIVGFNNRVFVADMKSGNVAFLNPFNIVTREIEVGGEPVSIAIDERISRIYVTNYKDRTIALLDPIGERVLKVLSVGGNTYGILLLER